MKNSLLLSAMALTVFARPVTGAEDHSKHQQPPAQGNEHAQHQQHQQPKAQGDEHAQHQQDATPPPQSSDPHAQHRSGVEDEARPQEDEHAHHRAAPSDERTESERAHIPPDPPQHFMGDMSKERMIELMQMEDDATFSMVLLDQLEWREIDDADAQILELQAWYGTDYNKIWIETEGERVDGEEEGRVELLWDRIISSWWSFQGGVRQDFGEGPSRTWADIGIQGLAPYFFEIDAALYVGEQGRTAARFAGEYDMLITQRLILQPEVEFELYGKDDPENGIGSGLSNVEVGVRLRYEIRREFAPYIGVQWERKFGGTADLAREHGEDVSDVQFVAGLRAWF